MPKKSKNTQVTSKKPTYAETLNKKKMDEEISFLTGNSNLGINNLIITNKNNALPTPNNINKMSNEAKPNKLLTMNNIMESNNIKSQQENAEAVKHIIQNVNLQSNNIQNNQRYANLLSKQNPNVYDINSLVSTQQEKITTSQRQVLAQETQVLPQETQVLAQETQVLPQETQVVPQDTQVVPQETEVLTKETEVLTKETEVLTKETEVSTKETEVSTKETEVSTKETEVTTNETEVTTNETEVTTNDNDNSNDEIDKALENFINNNKNNNKNIAVNQEVKLNNEPQNIDSNNDIPKDIYMCNHKIGTNEKIMALKWKKLNPDYKIHLYSDFACAEFITKHFSREYIKCFLKLKDGPIRADFWRLCILYKNGGVYSDIDNLPYVAINSFKEKDIDLLTCIADHESLVYNPNLIIVKKNNPLIKEVLDWYINRIKKVPYSYWSYSIMVAFSYIIKIHNFKKKEGVYNYKNNRIQLLSENKHSDMYKFTNLYKKKQIFKNRVKGWDYNTHKFKGNVSEESVESINRFFIINTL